MGRYLGNVTHWPCWYSTSTGAGWGVGPGEHRENSQKNFRVVGQSGSVEFVLN